MIMSIDIFYFKTVIIGGPIEENIQRHKTNVSERKKEKIST